MQEVHAKLVGEVASPADPMQALQRGIRVFLKLCSDPKLQQILLIIAGWTDHAAGFSAASPLASRWISARLIAACRVGALIWAPSRSVT
jgi:hypothetical protein